MAWHVKQFDVQRSRWFLSNTDQHTAQKRPIFAQQVLNPSLLNSARMTSLTGAT